jgi:hypothetical protein
MGGALWKHRFTQALLSPNHHRTPMTDPRNIAHDNKVQHEKKHRGEEIAPGAEYAVQPGKKPHLETTDKPDAETADKDEQPAG